MRIFMRQTNLIQTSPALDDAGEPVIDVTFTVKLFDSNDVLVPDSEIELEHRGGGIYDKVMDVLDDLEQNVTYYLEVSGVLNAKTVYYLKEPIKAIIRSSQPLR